MRVQGLGTRVYGLGGLFEASVLRIQKDSRTIILRIVGRQHDVGKKSCEACFLHSSRAGVWTAEVDVVLHYS